MKRCLPVILAVLAGCGYDDFGPYELSAPSAPAFNITLESLATHYGGSALDITQDFIVSGSVTSSDRAGNFYRTLVIQDATGALEIKTGLYDTHRIYPPGQRVTVRLNGLALGREAGVLQAGARAAPYSGLQTEYIGTQAAVSNRITRTGVYAPVTPADMTIASLSPSMAGKLVTVSGLRLSGDTPSALEPPSGSLTWGDTANAYSSTAYRKFKDASGDSLLMSVSRYARFAGTTIPGGIVSATGILLYNAVSGTHGNEMFIIKISDTADITAQE